MTSSEEAFDSPQAAMTRLKEGNQRFISGSRSIQPLNDLKKMKELANNGQKPFAIVLTCSDSRSPAELIFDQGLGDLFVVRVAGNVVAPSLLASIEYAAVNLGSKAVLVLGHTLCGAIGATIDYLRNPDAPLGSSHLEELIGRIQPSVYQMAKKYELDLQDPHFRDLAIEANVRRSVKQITDQSSILRKLAEQKQLIVQGSVLDIHTGKVRFLE